MRTSLLLLCIAMSWTARAETPTLVACAPGYPGSTREAQPSMDVFARALSEAAGWGASGLSAVYHETETGGLERLSRPDAAFALVPLAFYLEHQRALKLEPLCQAVRQGQEPNEVWSLVAGKRRVGSPQSLDGWELISLAAFSPRFVRGPALGGFGPLPKGTRLVASGSLLSGLRRAAAGEQVALLLDGQQAAGLATLPFAGELETLARSAPLPAFLVCKLKARTSTARIKALLRALLDLQTRPAGAVALQALQMTRFAPLDEASLRRAQQAYDDAAETP